MNLIGYVGYDIRLHNTAGSDKHSTTIPPHPVTTNFGRSFKHLKTMTCRFQLHISLVFPPDDFLKSVVGTASQESASPESSWKWCFSSHVDIVDIFLFVVVRILIAQLPSSNSKDESDKQSWPWHRKDFSKHGKELLEKYTDSSWLASDILGQAKTLQAPQAPKVVKNRKNRRIASDFGGALRGGPFGSSPYRVPRYLRTGVGSVLHLYSQAELPRT